MTVKGEGEAKAAALSPWSTRPRSTAPPRRPPPPAASAAQQSGAATYYLLPATYHQVLRYPLPGLRYLLPGACGVLRSRDLSSPVLCCCTSASTSASTSAADHGPDIDPWLVCPNVGAVALKGGSDSSPNGVGGGTHGSSPDMSSAPAVTRRGALAGSRRGAPGLFGATAARACAEAAADCARRPWARCVRAVPGSSSGR